MRTPRAADDRPEGLPPTPAGAITLALRNFANELYSLAAYAKGDRTVELKGQDSEVVRTRDALACALRSLLPQAPHASAAAHPRAARPRPCARSWTSSR
jgi:hypothetical protein